MSSPVVEVIDAHTLNASEAKKLASLTMRGRGTMKDVFYHRRFREGTKVLRITEKGKILAWALIYPRFEDTDFMVYVRHTERKHGYGTMLYEKAVELAGGKNNLNVHPWQGQRYYAKKEVNPSIMFFEKHVTSGGKTDWTGEDLINRYKEGTILR